MYMAPETEKVRHIIPATEAVADAIERLAVGRSSRQSKELSSKMRGYHPLVRSTACSSADTP
jgi:hypothetical protein